MVLDRLVTNNGLLYIYFATVSLPTSLRQCMYANENFNALLKVAPKILFSGINIVQIAAFLASCSFNDGMITILHAFQLLDIIIGPNLYNYCMQEDIHCSTFVPLKTALSI